MFLEISSLRKGAVQALGAAAIFMAATCSNASVVTVGDAAIDRPNNDSYSNFVITLPGDSFASNGTIDKWSAYVNNAETLGLLILSGATNAPTVVYSILETGLTVGLNTFTLGSVLSVSAGDYLGIWMGTDSKVDFDTSSIFVGYSSNSAYSSMPIAGTILATPGQTNRAYSINVNFTDAISTVPEPGTLALLGLSLAGLAAMRRRKQ